MLPVLQRVSSDVHLHAAHADDSEATPSAIDYATACGGDTPLMSPAALSDQVETLTQTPYHPFITMPLEPNCSILWSCSPPRETAEPRRLSVQDLMRSAYKTKESFFHPLVTTSDQRVEAPAEFDSNPPSHRHRAGKRAQALLCSNTSSPFVTRDIIEILAIPIHEFLFSIVLGYCMPSGADEVPDFAKYVLSELTAYILHNIPESQKLPRALERTIMRANASLFAGSWSA